MEWSMEIGHEQPAVPTCLIEEILLVEDMWMWSKLCCLYIDPPGFQFGERFHLFSGQGALQETRSSQKQLYWWGPRGKQGLPESSTKLEGSDCGQVKGTWQERPRGMWQVGVQGPLRRVHLPPGVSALCWAAQARPPLANKGHRSGALVHVRRC